MRQHKTSVPTASADFTELDVGKAIAEEALTPLIKLQRDIKAAATKLTTPQARYLVDNYYAIQEFRKASGNQSFALTNSGEPVEVIQWLENNMYTLEKQIKSVLDTWSSSHPVGVWCKSICGIGPVLASALLAYIDITKAKTAGAIWRFAGIDPNSKWIGNDGADKIIKEVLPPGSTEVTYEVICEAARLVNRRPETLQIMATDDETQLITIASLKRALALRPWNARLKVIAWKIGECFVKVSNNPKDVYGKIYVARKVQEDAKNNALEFASQAQAILATKKIGHSTDAYKAYIQGKLPPAHIHSRAKRYAVKLFLSAYHEVAYFQHFGVMPPKPYVISILGHAHYIAPPNMDLIPGLTEAHNGY